MIEANFYPGPSRVYSNIPEYFYDAYMKGYLSCNHRSEQFMMLMEETKAVLKEKLLIPADFEIVFTSSATECWEIIAQSLTHKGSQHFYNGAFGEKWASYAGRLTSTVSTVFEVEEKLPVDDLSAKVDMLCVTQNETSNGTAVSMKRLQKLSERREERLLAVDCTSSMGGQLLDFALADIWFASVQKCFGLPAGMAMMVLSPKAMHAARRIGEQDRYNSLMRLIENATKNQTSYTPNVLGIYLLYRTQKESKGIEHIQSKLVSRFDFYTTLLEGLDILHLVENPSLRSLTVLAVKHSKPSAIIKKAKERQIVLGAGYGQWKAHTFRIANFPAIKSKEIEKLRNFFVHMS